MLVQIKLSIMSFVRNKSTMARTYLCSHKESCLSQCKYIAVVLCRFMILCCLIMGYFLSVGTESRISQPLQLDSNSMGLPPWCQLRIGSVRVVWVDIPFLISINITSHCFIDDSLLEGMWSFLINTAKINHRIITFRIFLDRSYARECVFII